MSKVTTFSTIIAIIDDQGTLSIPRRRELKYAAKRVADLVSAASLDQEINLAAIVARLRAASPAMAGMSKRSFSNLVSRFRRALKLAGFEIHPGKQTNELLDEWEALRKVISDERRWR